jgi:hypothetical protein
VLVGPATGGTIDCDLSPMDVGPAFAAQITIDGFVTSATPTNVSNTAQVDPDGLVSEGNESNNSSTANTSVLIATPTPTPTPDLSVDTDGDGCADIEELGPSEVVGGRRDPANPYDFYDVPMPAGDPGTGAKDKVISVADMSGLVAKFGTFLGGDRNANGHIYNAEFDRTPLGPDVWDLGPPNGSVTIQDIQLMIPSFGHSCANPP